MALYYSARRFPRLLLQEQRLTLLRQQRSYFTHRTAQQLLVRQQQQQQQQCHPLLVHPVRYFASPPNGETTTTTTTAEVSSEDLELALNAVKDDISPSDEPQLPGAQKGGKKLAIVFTCTVCDTRSAKQFTEQAYQNGVVMVRCPGCDNNHLIADRLGFFQDESWDIEMAMKGRQEEVTVVTNDNVLEITLKDVMGKEKWDKAMVGEDIATAEIGKHRGTRR